MVFRSSDTSPKEVNIYHGAGARGAGSSSYIDAMILRDFDSTGDYESGTADGVLQDRYYHCQNWRQDTAALVEVAGASTTRLSEQVRYSAYGMPFGLPKGDADVDGETKVADETQIQTWISGSQYLVRGDVDLDGDVDTSDKSIVSIQIGAVLGRTKLSTNPDNGIGNRHGYASYQHDRTITRNHVRHRVYDPDTGRWTRRDPIGHQQVVSQYGYVTGESPIVIRDPMGLCPNGNCFVGPKGHGEIGGWNTTPRHPYRDPNYHVPGEIIVGDQCAAQLLEVCSIDPEFREALGYMQGQCASSQVCPGGWKVICGSTSWANCSQCTIQVDPNNGCASLAHELVHAGDFCFAGCRGSDYKFCEFWMCSEYRAIHTGCCNWKDYTPGYNSYEECVQSKIDHYKDPGKNPKCATSTNWPKVEGCCGGQSEADCGQQVPYFPHDCLY